MPANRNSLIRYRTIDQCLSNRSRRWTLQNLIDACSDALYEYEGITKGISRRTIQGDIQMMRSDKLGYNAPIIVVEKKYYTYEDPNYSITNNPLTEADLSRLTEVVEILKQFKDFSHFQDLEGMVQKLEDKVASAQQRRRPIIQLERNERLQGLEFLDRIYQAVLNKEVLKVYYQPFWRENAMPVMIHPYLLKEYQNRWYAVGFSDSKKKISLLALDRIQSIELARTPFIENNFFNPDLYFKDVIGVTVFQNSEPTKVVLFVRSSNVPYVLTKPLHASQKVLRDYKDGVLIELTVRINFELKNHIRALGANIMVVAPTKLRTELQEEMKVGAAMYEDKKLRGELWKVLNAL